ncbi:hypothetical protein BH09ACT1_BH09ACT1_21960 [soil metagenome]
MAARIQINGSDLAVQDADGATIASLPYSDDLMTTVASLEALLSEKATHTTIAATQCNYAEDSYGWGDGLTVRFPSDPGSGWTNVVVTSRADSIGTASVGTPGGFGVGDASSALIAGIPGSTVEDFGDATSGGTQVWYDLDAEDTGVIASAETLHGTIDMVSAPWSKGSDC